jgi:hypothetical protein
MGYDALSASISFTCSIDGAVSSPSHRQPAPTEIPLIKTRWSPMRIPMCSAMPSTSLKPLMTIRLVSESSAFFSSSTNSEGPPTTVITDSDFSNTPRNMYGLENDRDSGRVVPMAASSVIARTRPLPSSPRTSSPLICVSKSPSWMSLCRSAAKTIPSSLSMNFLMTSPN